MNLLSIETSPYLRQHENNPVYWMPWGETALAKAKAEDKPILLSVGYAACHWCHVMAHESFEDPHIAALMNTHYICIKVDREERPDIDALYQQSLALMGKQGGWPLTMVLTPEGKSFWGGTYFPPIAMQGLPAFRDVLTGLAEAWQIERDKIDHNIGTLHVALEGLQKSTRGSGQISRQWFDQIAGALESRVDPVHGGFGGAPKFPQLPAISFLWDFHIHSGRDSLKSSVIQTLTSLCQGGIYDHVGGGIARYAVDQEWLVPHFEKMLPDNALFIGMLAEVYRETQNPLFAARVRQTVSFLKREMMVEEGGSSAFASSLDADSEGAEGVFYVWTLPEIEEALGADAAGYMETYDITRFGNWHDGGDSVSIPNRLQSPLWLGDDAEDVLAEQNDRLLDIRLHRPLPGRDTKILADWNGWMIDALARASFAFDAPDYLDLARHVFAFVRKYMMQDDGKLYHSFCEGKPGVRAMLDDYAAMGLAALSLYEATFDPSYLEDAKSWAQIMLSTDFYDDASGLFHMTPADTLLPLRMKPVDDSALASGNAAAAQFLARLGILGADAAYTAKARRMIEAISGDLARGYFTRCGFLKAGLLLDHGLQLHAPAEFDDTIRKLSLPLALRLPVKDGIDKDKAEVCTTRQCLPAVKTEADLDRMLREERQRQVLISANDD